MLNGCQSLDVPEVALADTMIRCCTSVHELSRLVLSIMAKVLGSVNVA